jgi:hypothetical protein
VDSRGRLFSGKKAPKEAIDRAKTETCVKKGSLINMKTFRLIIAALIVVLGVTMSRADVTTDLKKTTVDINTQAQTNAGRTRVLTAISGETGVSVTTLQSQQSATKLGFGDLTIANLLASASGKTFDQIVAMFKAGEGWGKIAKDLDLNLGMIVSKAKRADQAALQAQTGQGSQRSQTENPNSSQMGNSNFGPTNNPGMSHSAGMGMSRGGGRP